MKSPLLFLLLYIIHFTQSRPNIIIIYPDNQDLLLGSTDAEYMPILNSHIIDSGITIENGFVSTPICCPSRAELLTGRYFHNIGPPYPPNGSCMHIDPYLPVFNNNTLFQLMYDNGYHTGAFGKIVNDMPFWCNQNKKPEIQGYSRLYIPCNYLNYYGHVYFNKFENDTYTYSYTNNSYESPTLYETSQIGNATIDWINELYSNNETSDPNNISFFALWGVHAPHHPATPAAWYQYRFNDTEKYIVPRTPNFNQHYPNRHWLVDQEPELDQHALSFIDQWWRNRLRSMLSVDDFIYELDKTLTKWNIKDNTYVFYVSDNGMHFGQWRLPCNFRNIYETDIRVPFFVSGPNITAKSRTNKMISNVDIAPTIYELAGIEYDRNEYGIDGMSFKKHLFQEQDKIIEKNENIWRDMLLFEFIWVNNETLENFPVWYPSVNSYEGKVIKPPCCNNMTGEPFRVDNSYETSFRALRIINSTFNIAYGEYIQGTYTQQDLDNPLFYELYNITDDPYQMNNIYYDVTESMKNYLHQTLFTYGSCKGTECP